MSEHQLSIVGSVTPPGDMHEAARLSLSPEGYERLMAITAGAAPTPAQLCREADFEREGFYPPIEVTPAELVAIRQEAFLIAAAKSQLSPSGFRHLMDSIDWRAPTSHELVAAVEAERAAKSSATN